MIEELTAVESKIVKPGVKTTEFWITLIVQLCGILSISGVITPNQGQVIQDTAQQIPQVTGCFQQIGGMIMMLGSAFGYSWLRTKTKV